MGSVHPFVPASRGFLDPDHLRVASHAFDTALRSLDGRGNALSPHRIRHLLASFIIERVMDGDKDAEDLALQAVASLESSSGQAPDAPAALLAGYGWSETATRCL